MLIGHDYRMQNLKVLWMAWTLFIFSLVSCAPLPPPPPPDTTNRLLEFGEGIQHIAKTFLGQFEASQYQHERKVEKEDPLLQLQRQAQRAVGKTQEVVIKKTVVDPFLMVETGEMLKINYVIEILMARVMTPKLGISKMTPENLSTAEYVINGMIALETHPTVRQRTYRLYASLFEKKTGIIIGSSDVWVKNLEYQPLEVYKDSPVYIKDRGLDNLVSSVKRGIGQTVDRSYLSTLDVRSLLVEGDTFYEKRDYENALPFYEEAEHRIDGKTMKVYSGLYNIYRLQQDANSSEMAFGRLVEISVAEKNEISVKLLFDVNTADFISESDVVREYKMWLRQISKYVERTPNVCLRVVGHASRSGKPDYNLVLSRKRAESVQRIMGQTYPDISRRSESIGKGFEQNIIGTGADNISDAIDRRVEFLLKSC